MSDFFSSTGGRIPTGYRLIVTIVAPVAIYFLGYIPSPLWAQLTAGNPYLTDGIDPVTVGLFPFGIRPVIEAFILVEIIAWAIPRFRRLRIGGMEGRRKMSVAVAVTAMVFTLIQSHGLTSMLVSTNGFTAVPAELTGLDGFVTLMTWTAGVVVQVMAIHVVSCYGLGNGFSVFIAFELLPQLKRLAETAWRGGESPAEEKLKFVLGIGFVLCIALWTRYMLLKERRNRSAGPLDVNCLRYPTSGLVPLMWAFALLSAVSAADLMGLDTDWYRTIFEFDALHHYAVNCGLIAVLSVVFSGLFNRPKHVVKVVDWFSGDGFDPEAYKRVYTKSLVRATAINALLLVALFSTAEFACMLSPDLLCPFTSLGNIVALAVMTAVIMDIREEYHFRKKHPDVESVRPLNRVYEAHIAVDVLRKAGIDVLPRSLYHRTLLQFFGPHIPIDLTVPFSQKEKAIKLLKEATPSIVVGQRK